MNFRYLARVDIAEIVISRKFFLDLTNKLARYNDTDLFGKMPFWLNW